MLVHYDPADHGHDDPPPPARWPDYLIATLLVLLIAAGLHSCAEAATPMAVVLPNGEETTACGFAYTPPPAGLIVLHPCEDVFVDGFESL